jgi:hypothetical protein
MASSRESVAQMLTTHEQDQAVVFQSEQSAEDELSVDANQQAIRARIAFDQVEEELRSALAEVTS